MGAIEPNGECISSQAPAHMLKSGPAPVLRAIRLLWGRMGAARFYVLTAASLIVLLAAVGVFHLASARSQSGAKARGQAASNAQAEFSRTISPPAADYAIPEHPVIAITEVAPEKRFGRHGEVRVDVKIGVTPQPNTRKGQVEIRVFFYDVTPSREMRPTQAKVAYQWLTPERDWTDPSPKYLVATYLRPREARRSSEKLQYGGFVVRIYFDGELQDEKSEPEELIVTLQSRARSVPAPTHAESPASAAAAAGPSPSQVAVIRPEVTSNMISPSPIAVPKPSEKRTTEDSATLPYARPVPGKPGFVYSPYDEKFLIDVRGAPPGTVVNDPNSGKAFRVP
jgi:hypothetical protein